ncbi:MAG TPA: hypothetical protein VK348_05115, partial [Planctomycetota bacterium]|nr:hypothetical protein [Planctomycetota bacterium]
FPALARLLKQRLERTGVAALEQLLLTSLREVTVRARLEPVGKDPQWLHIDQYDDLLAGEMKSEYGRFPGASREQFARLAADLRRIDSMVAVLRSIDEQCRSGLRPLADLVEQVASACNRFCDRVETRPRDEWQLLTARLQAVVDDPAAGAARERARSALALAVQFEADWDAGVRIAAALRRALQPLAKPAPQLLGELLAADSPLRQGLLSLAPDIDRCAASTAAWPERRRQLATAVSELRTARPELGMSEAMQTFLVFVPLDLAAVAERLRRFAARFQDRDIAAAAIDLMAGQDLAAARIDPRLLQPLTNTPEARIDLGRTNVREGDRLRIEAVYRPQGDGDGKPAARENWEMEITRFGLYPKVTAELIFARADHGTVDAERWKPNAAAVAEVHNRFRDPSRWGEAWNLIDPALGVHLASLDQTDISVDFGLGFNVSVLGGFVTAGYGWNLAASADRGYYFIGIDLLNVLRNAQHFITGGG